MKNVMYGKTKVVISADNAALGRDSASMVAMQMRELLKKQNAIRMVFAAGESQSTFLNALALEKNIDWQSVICFNIDDFWDVCIAEKFLDM